ncbi:uncharacterized protein KZ484_012906 [Pholidichthys leucotaenia]
MIRGVFLFILVRAVEGLWLKDTRRGADDLELNKAILEMLHINKVSASHQAKPHPYMKRIFQNLDFLEKQDAGRSDGTLVQSFRSSDGKDLKVVTEKDGLTIAAEPERRLGSKGPLLGPQGWIWFNVTGLSSSMLAAELVLFRKTLHYHPLSITVTLHSILASEGHLSESPTLEERQLTLDQRPPSEYDVFDVSSILHVNPLEVVGFQLRYTDESGSLVIHEALTQSLYCLSRGSLNEPLLVLYQKHPLHV